MSPSIGHVTLLVRDYDEALAFYCDVLGFTLVEDTAIPEQGKRWVLIAPPGAPRDAGDGPGPTGEHGGTGPATAPGTQLLLARAVGAEQVSRIGNQTGGRVFLFLHTDDFWRDYRDFRARGVVFVREPTEERYGTVAVFEDLYGNLWDLVQVQRRS